MKIFEKTYVGGDIDQDIGVPDEHLQKLLLEGKNAPTIPWDKEKIKKQGREMLKKHLDK